MKNLKTFLHTLKKEGFTALYKESEDSIIVRTFIEGFLLEFVLEYDSHRKNYMPETFDNPEEYDLAFENTGFNNVAVYKDEVLVDLSEEEVLQIEATLESIIY